MRSASLLTVVLSATLGAGSAVVVMKLRTRRVPAALACEGAPVDTAAVAARRAWLSRTALALQPSAPPFTDEAELARRVAAGPPRLDPVFSARMVAKLSSALGAVVMDRRGELLEVRCQGQTCVARAQWPAEVGRARALDPAGFVPDEPGCTREMLPSRAEQLAVTEGLVRISFYFRCPDWVDQQFETAAAEPGDEGEQPTP